MSSSNLIFSSKTSKRRNKIIMYNNYCIMEFLSFYDNFFLNNIIQKYLFNGNYNKNKEIRKKVATSISFMNKYKIVKSIAEGHGIKFKFKVDDVENVRNNIAHNLSFAVGWDDADDGVIIIFGGKKMSWIEYLEEIEKWSVQSYKVAEDVRELYSKNNPDVGTTAFPYYELEGKCVLKPKNLLFSKNNEDDVGTFQPSPSYKLDEDVQKWMNEEIKYKEEVDLNE